ncbi:MAG: serine/threonine protein kinase [Planctomycetes bacterium]|nr:serine/threonine protein kinase [Planctomycetota bacterium]
MNPERYARARELFLLALETPPADLAAVLEAHGGGDPELRVEVLALLAQHRAGASFLERPASSALSVSLTAQVPGYRLLDLIGEGGMGVVYRAEQEHPRRIVALKLVRPGFATPRTMRRFEHEAEVLARLQHPAIAQIHAAGQADGGAGPQPFFAMEYVAGQPLTTWADRRRLEVRARVELLARVCDGVQHAHQKGVVHCDLKPANILVDEAGQPRILDFGIARLVEENPLATQQSAAPQILGTLAYMSPEQAAGDRHAVDTRSDVWALGVIGYELLTHRLPVDTSAMDLLPALAALRSQLPVPMDRHDRALRGDLTTIVHKALQHDRDQRYASAAGLAGDLRRWLRHEPILARPASAWYTARTFARRHRSLVLASAVVAATLLVAIVGTATGMLQAQAAERRATVQGGLAERTSDFLERTILTLDPAHTGSEVRMVDVLRGAATAVPATFADAPLAAARVRTTLGRSFLGLSCYEDAERELAVAFDLRRAHLGPDADDTVATRTWLAMALKARGQPAAAAAHFQQVLERHRRLLGADDPVTLNALHNLAEILEDQGQLEAARAAYLEVLERRTRTVGADDLLTLATRNNLAALAQHAGGLADAETQLREIVAIRTRTQGADHPELLVAINNLAQVLTARGQPAAAVPLLREVVARQTRVLGADHADTLAARDNLARANELVGEVGEAEAELRAVLAARERLFGANAAAVVATRMGLATMLLRVGRGPAARALLESTWASWDTLLRDDGERWLAAQQYLAWGLQSIGQAADAEELWEDLLVRLNRNGRVHAHRALTARHNLSAIRWGNGDAAGAKAILAEAVRVARVELSPADPELHESLYGLAFMHSVGNEPAPAIPLLRELLGGYLASIGPHDPKALVAQATLARCLQLTDDPAAASEFTVLDERIAAAGLTADQGTMTALNRIGVILGQAGRHAGAVAAFDRLELLANERPSALGPLAAAYPRNRAESLVQNGRFAEAKAVFLRLLAEAERGGSGAAAELPRLWRGLVQAHEGMGETEAAAAIRARLESVGGR